MSRRWIIGIVFCCLLAGPSTISWGQEYLDLPEEPSSGSSSLTEKFLSLKDKFRREPKQSKPKSQPASRSQRTNPRNPRYRSSQSTRQAQSKPANRTQPQPQRRLPTKQASTPRPKTSDLLPDTKLFSRSSQPLPSSPPRKPQQLTRAKTLPHLGAVNNKPAPPKVARRSPSTSRANELEAALADLMQTKPAAPTKPATQRYPIANTSSATKPKQASARKSPKTTNPISSSTFDLRKALLDADEDSIAAEAAKAVEDAVAAANVKAEAKPKSPVVKVPESKPPIAKSPFRKPVEQQVSKVPATESKPVKTKPIEKTIEAPAIVSNQEVISTPSSKAKPIVTEPLNEPIVIAMPQQAIIVAEPQSKPQQSYSAANLPKLDSDPFEDTAKKVFSSPVQTSNPMRPFMPASKPERPKETIAQPKQGVLQSSQQPVIVSQVEGPRSILVGREATYQITLENTSNTDATNVSTEISVPEWAELVDAMSTSGVVERRDQGISSGVLEWKLSGLAARSSQALRLRLIPRSGRPLQLGVRWTQAPVQSQAIVEVQEPKLELAISGPQEVRFGKPQRYRLTLRNPGTGTTEQVSLRLVPPGGSPQSATTQKIGDLKPGEVRDIDLELTAREAGELLIQADAHADGGLTAETTKTVLCRKPELDVDWRGPDKKYAGTVAAYYFRVRNPGTAATEPVNVSVKLPAGAEFVDASEGFSINAANGVVSWRLAAIDVKEEQFMQLRCKIVRPGVNDFKLLAKTKDGELTDSKNFNTEVVALADLKLEVSDPQGPLPLGEVVIYDIRVRNRGTTEAENINIVGLFSEGIDPTTVEGAQFTVRDGRVSFHPIKSLPAGREVLLRIHAKASQVGTHTFRTEVTCPKLDIKLAAEETTRFFEDEHRWEDGQTPYSAEREDAIRQ